MSAEARTSVILPARNAGNTIAETLDSLLAQTDAAWEALIVDDGSTDATAAIIASYAARDNRFILLAGSGTGASVARNAGLARARGSRVLFLDADDWIDEHFLRTMNEALDEQPDAVAAYCAWQRVMPDGQRSPIRGIPGIAEAPFEAFARSCATAIHSVLIETQAVFDAGGFDPGLRTCEDWDLWQRVARGGRPWIYVDQAMSYYRAGDQSLTQDVQQMLGDARIVIARGFSTDERVPHPAAAHLAGACPAGHRTAAVAFAYFSLWCAALDCGRGRQGTASPEVLADLAVSPDLEAAAVSVLFDGVMVGLRTPPERMASRWQHFGPAITSLISSLGVIAAPPPLVKEIQSRFERLVFDCETEAVREVASRQQRDALPASQLVSVVIPAYNAQATIDATLRSVRAQTHRNLEIMVVDDGSTDGTKSIAEAHAAVDGRVKVASQENAGVADARNRGWRAVRGDLIAFVDADDLWAPAKIERQLEAMLAGGERVGLVYTWFAEIDAKDRISKWVSAGAITGNVLERMFIGNLVGNGSSALVRRRALVAVGGFESGLQAAGAHGCEDFLFYFRVAARFDFELVPDYLTGYRFLCERMSSNRPRMLKSWMMVADEMKHRYPERHALVDEGLKYYVRFLLGDALAQLQLRQMRTLLSLWRPQRSGGRVLTIPGMLAGACVESLSRAIRFLRSRYGRTGYPQFLIGEPVL